MLCLHDNLTEFASDRNLTIRFETDTGNLRVGLGKTFPLSFGVSFVTNGQALIRLRTSFDYRVSTTERTRTGPSTPVLGNELLAR